MTEGDLNPKTKTLTMTANGTELASGRPYEARMISVIKDKDTPIYTMSVKNEQTKGEFVKFVEITYTKRPD